MSMLTRVLEKLGLWQFDAPKPAKRSYAGAQINRLTNDWYASILSADQELKGDLRRLRGASRSLVRDNGEASRYVQMVAENVVGHKGIQLQMEFMTTRGDPASSLNDQVEAAWEEWSYPENADAGRRLSWVEQQMLVVRALAQDGEALVHMVPGAPNAFGFAIQILDADQLDETLGGASPVKLPNGNEIRMGVEVDGRFGAPVAYHLWTEHPSESGSGHRRRQRIPAEELLHLYIVLRPGQTRGVPWFAPVLVAHKMCAAYEEAEITAARIGASNMAAVAIDAEKAGSVAVPNAGETSIPYELEPGSFFRLGAGESLVSTDFGHPSTAFGPFTKNIKRAIATGLNVSYTALTGDLEAVNYSSIRAGLLSERDFYRVLQTWLSCHFHRVVFREWTKHAGVNGQIPVRLPADYARAASWKPRGWKWVDPLNDVQASALAVQEGFSTRSDICGELGLDFEENIDRRAHEEQYAIDSNVVLGAAKPVVPRQPDTGSPDAESAAPAASPEAARFYIESIALQSAALETARSQKAATDWMATREMPAPVVHVDVAPPDVTLNVTLPKSGPRHVTLKRNDLGEMVTADITES
jgi:lambda family phage portal protein